MMAKFVFFKYGFIILSELFLKFSPGERFPTDLSEVINKAPKVYRRAHWDAKEPKDTVTLETPVNKLVITWTETDPCYTEDHCMKQVVKLQQEHMKKGLPDIKHNFLIGGEGSLYEGRGFTVAGPKYDFYKAKHLYTTSIEIAFINRSTSKPHAVHMKSLTDCIAFGVSGNYILPEFTFYWINQSGVLYIQPSMLST